MNPAGQIFNAFTSEEVDSWVNRLKTSPVIEIKGNDCHGVDEKNILNFWFQKTIFSRINELFGQDIKLVFGMFLNETKPWKIHTDSYHCHGFDDRIPALSILIPYSVDHNKDLVDCTRTIVFNEWSSDKTGIFEKLVDDKTDHPNSAVAVYNEHLSHNKVEDVKKLTIQGIYQWQANSIIYWNSLYLHDTDNFLKNGFQNKQAIVMHTYRQR